MQAQKKRNTSKKIKSNKSETELKMPLGTLMSQISQLKSQLAEIKSKKSIRPQKNGQSQQRLEIDSQVDLSKISYKSQQDYKREMYRPGSKQNLHQNLKEMFSIGSPKGLNIDQNKTMSKFPANPNQYSSESSGSVLNELKFPIRQHELKLNIQFNKLYRYIKSLPSEQHCQILLQQLNRNIEFLNKFIQEALEHQNNDLIQTNTNHTFDLEYLLAEEKQRVSTLQEINRGLEREILELKHALAVENDEAVVRNQESNQIRETNLDLMEKQKELVNELEHVRIAYEGLKEERERLQQKLRVFQKAVEQKQEQILVLEQDISYNRQESQKHKCQKKQLQKVYKQINDNYKMLKNKYENEVQAVNKQKQKWKKECEKRRMGQNEVINHQEQKNALKKELQEMRRENLLKNTQYNEVKSKLHEEQRRNINLQGENYQLTGENEKLKRALQFCKQEIKDMGQEVEEMRKSADQNRRKNCEESKKIKKSETLDEIRQLIEGHRKAVLEEDSLLE